MTSSTMSRLRPVRLRRRPSGLGNLWHMTLRNLRVPLEGKPELRPGDSAERDACRASVQPKAAAASGS